MADNLNKVTIYPIYKIKWMSDKTEVVQILYLELLINLLLNKEINIYHLWFLSRIFVK